MRSLLLWAAAAALVATAAAEPRQSGQNSQQQNQASSAAQAPSPGQPAQPQQDALAAAARKARAQKKEAPKAAKVFTNDNLPVEGGVSFVGAAPSAAPGETSTGAAKVPAKSGGNDEKAWREKFAQLRHKLEQDQQELAVMQRELSVANVQYYSNPQQEMEQEYTRSDINNRTDAIDAQRKQIEADQQAIAQAEDDLRKSGGDAGWAR